MSNGARRQRGFTLIELLTVVLMIAILMAVAMPLYLGAVTNAEVTTCRANMQSIANAEQAYRARDDAHNYTTVLADLPVDLGSIPVCPRGGEYSVTLATGNETSYTGKPIPAGVPIIACDASGHGTFAPGIDTE
ncbi:MAG: prepilin-type N-terminal cleavage/methylation domain-containing protein [Chthonomonadales bacterium]|nr:prepilin-type N-terminal cleavage/methylation domain-containing protein [Chthonomonadales bacterium]